MTGIKIVIDGGKCAVQKVTFVFGSGSSVGFVSWTHRMSVLIYEWLRRVTVTLPFLARFPGFMKDY